MKRAIQIDLGIDTEPILVSINEDNSKETVSELIAELIEESERKGDFERADRIRNMIQTHRVYVGNEEINTNEVVENLPFIVTNLNDNTLNVARLSLKEVQRGG